MAENFFRVRKGLSVANSSASANLDPITLTIGSTIANTLGVYAGIINATTVNAATHSVGATFTANATLINTAAINITGQVNTATFFAATSANVGANVQITTVQFVAGNSTANLNANSILVKIANSTGTANLQPTQLVIGTSTVNTTVIAAGANVIANTSGFFKNTNPVLYASDADQTIVGGARVTVLDLGTKSTGTVTPDPGDRPMQKYTNGGAHTLAPGSNYGNYILDILNTTGAGNITTSGWTFVAGDLFDTTTTSKFRCFCSITSDFSVLQIVKVA